jgi:hypothetical protein
MPAKHGLRKTSEYVSWASMKGRCLNPNNPKFPRYGARGIRVCPEWVSDFAAFYVAMGSKPSPAHSLDRIDNNGDYCPANCRWAEPSTQSNNRSTTRQFTYDGRQCGLRELAAIYKVPYKRLKHRLEHGWSISDAIETPIGADEKHIAFQGRSQSLSAWGREVGLSGACVSERLRAGWSIERTLTTPAKRYRQEIA